MLVLVAGVEWSEELSGSGLWLPWSSSGLVWPASGSGSSSETDSGSDSELNVI